MGLIRRKGGGRGRLQELFDVADRELFHVADCESCPVKGSNLLESLEHSMNPELQKYARETDNILDSSLSTLKYSNEVEMDVYQEHFGTRFVVECQEFQLRLQVNLAEDRKPQLLDNPEPFFITLSLYDAREGKKISEDFHFDPNKKRIRSMIPNELLNTTDMLNSVNRATSGEPDLYRVDSKWLAYCDCAIYTVARPHHEHALRKFSRAASTQP
ncbi:Dedicator of cytokinesis protein 10 [Lamellibrachia satsuma]|nr:Dedicator of cytokinesis protein 10 [Lamellibrachia satsuma]